MPKTGIAMLRPTKVWESLFIKVSGFLNKKTTIENIYTPPPLGHKKDHDTF